MRTEGRHRPAAVLGTRGSGERLASDPRRAACIVDAGPPAAGARPTAAGIASVRDRSGSGDEHDAGLTAERTAPGDLEVGLHVERGRSGEIELGEQRLCLHALFLARHSGEAGGRGPHRFGVAAERAEGAIPCSGERGARALPADVVRIRGAGLAARDHAAVETRERDPSLAATAIDSED